MGFPAHLVNLLMHPHKRQKANIKTVDGVSGCFSVKKGVRQGCIIACCRHTYLIYYCGRYDRNTRHDFKLEDQFFAFFLGVTTTTTLSAYGPGTLGRERHYIPLLRRHQLWPQPRSDSSAETPVNIIRPVAHYTCLQLTYYSKLVEKQSQNI